MGGAKAPFSLLGPLLGRKGMNLTSVEAFLGPCVPQFVLGLGWVPQAGLEISLTSATCSPPPLTAPCLTDLSPNFLIHAVGLLDLSCRGARLPGSVGAPPSPLPAIPHLTLLRAKSFLCSTSSWEGSSRYLPWTSVLKGLGQNSLGGKPHASPGHSATGPVGFRATKVPGFSPCPAQTLLLYLCPCPSSWLE